MDYIRIENNAEEPLQVTITAYGIKMYLDQDCTQFVLPIFELYLAEILKIRQFRIGRYMNVYMKLKDPEIRRMLSNTPLIMFLTDFWTYLLYKNRAGILPVGDQRVTLWHGKRGMELMIHTLVPSRTMLSKI